MESPAFFTKTINSLSIPYAVSSVLFIFLHLLVYLSAHFAQNLGFFMTSSRERTYLETLIILPYWKLIHTYT